MRKESFIKRTISQTNRFREIITVLVKYGLSDYVHVLRLDKSLSLVRRILVRGKQAELSKYSKWERLRMAIEELGPTFVKLGQLLSNRKDLLPEPMLIELEKLQDKVPPISEEQIRRVIRMQFKKPIESIFTEFKLTPVASASVAQVHWAKLPGGKEVAVKIQRPGIEKIVDTDLEILSGLAALMERYIPDMKLFHPIGLVEQFRIQMKIELNFERERLHIQKFANLFNNERSIKVPVVYDDYSCRRIITMEFIHGEKVSRITEGIDGRYNRRIVALRGANLILEQIFIHGFFHADPHPGNIMVLEDNVICFLDFGMVGRVRPKEKDNLTMMFLGMTNRNAEQVSKAVLNITTKTRPVDFDELEVRIYDLLEEYLDLSLEDFDLTSLLQDMINLIRSFGLIIPSNLTLMIKALIATEAIGMELDPSFNLIRFFKPFARRLVAREFHPKTLAHEAFQTAISYKDFLESFPEDMSGVLKTVKNGNLKVQFLLKGLERFRFTLDRISYRLIYGIVLSSILISSSLILMAEIPPTWNGMSIIGLVGFSMAGIMGVVIVFSLIIQTLRR